VLSARPAGNGRPGKSLRLPSSGRGKITRNREKIGGWRRREAEADEGRRRGFGKDEGERDETKERGKKGGSLDGGREGSKEAENRGGAEGKRKAGGRGIGRKAEENASAPTALPGAAG
jgi:hypothetical protein